jgi:hypothetical protein
MKTRYIVLVIGGIAFIALIISLSLLLGNKFQPQTCGCPKVISNNFVYLFVILGIVFAICLLYYLFSLRINEKDKIIGKNVEFMYSILDDEEKEVLKMIVKSKGEISQQEISKRFGKIRAHRVLKKMQDKKIISVIKDGKTNKIKLNDEIRKELVK